MTPHSVPAQPVDIIASLAHRQGKGIRLVLHLPELEVLDVATVPVRFTDGNRSVRRSATVTPVNEGILLELTVAAKRLGRGIWTLALRPETPGRFVGIEARLLTGRRQPVALIPGPVPDTRLPEPRPTPRLPEPIRARRLPARVVGRVRRSLRRRR